MVMSQIDPVITGFDLTQIEVSKQADVLEWETIGTAYNPSLSSIQSFRVWDNSFRQGELGAFRFDFKAFPNLGKDWLKKTIDGTLEARGVDVWKPSEWDGNALVIYWRTGFAPLAIAAIALGALLLVSILVASITIYKLKKIEVEARVERQEVILDELIESIENLPDNEKVKVLLDIAEEENQDARETFDIFENPAKIAATVTSTGLVIVALVAAVMVVLRVFKGG